MRGGAYFPPPMKLRLLNFLPVFLTVAMAGAAQFKFGNQTFTVPKGFTVERVTGPPLVNRPIEASFDEQGRLYVTDSSGSNARIPEQIKNPTHRVVRLEDTNGDGKFDKSVVFADKMMFPEGVLWHDGALYVSGVPIIWKLEDTTGDGRADKRTKWFDGKTANGCANDLHGPYLGLDGWIYWCKGAFERQRHQRPRGQIINDRASHIYRMRPDGTEFDSIMAGGMDNPVGMAFSDTGEVFFTTTFFNHPRSGNRDALVHAVYGGLYPKNWSILDKLTRTGDLMPPLSHLGPAAPCGLTAYESEVFGKDFKGNLFTAQFNMHKVQRHVLSPSGATFTSRDLDFMVSDNPDFHPTDVLEDADGSLLVIDTGGWYKLCCPTSQIAKPEVLGAIYRIRRTDAQPVNDPRGLKMDWAKMTAKQVAGLLDDARPYVRHHAIHQIGGMGVKGASSLIDTINFSKSATARRNAVWAATRLGENAAWPIVPFALNDTDPTVQQAAAHYAGIHRYKPAVPVLVKFLKSKSLHVRREAATALGCIGDKRAVPALLAAAQAGNGRVLEHSLIYALIEIGDAKGTAAGLASKNPHAQRAALIALDQMPGAKVTAMQLLPRLASNDEVLRKTALWLFERHPEMAKEMAGFLKTQLAKAAALSKEQRAELERQLAGFAHDPAVQEVMTAALATEARATRWLVFDAMAGASVKKIPAAWSQAVEDELGGKDEAVTHAALNAAYSLGRAAKFKAFNASLLKLATDFKRPAELRLNAVAAITTLSAPLDAGVFSFLQIQIAPDQPAMRRAAAASQFARAKLSGAQQLALIKSIPAVGPLELTRLLRALTAKDEKTGRALIAALAKAEGLGGLSESGLRTALAPFPPAVREAAAPLLKKLAIDIEAQAKRLAELESNLKGGDIGRGHLIFNGKAICITCHKMGYRGGKMGPDLTRIGGVRTERDLLEAIAFPSASFVRGYEPMLVKTKNGEQSVGVILSETATHIQLALGPALERRVPRNEIAEITPSPVSLMPAGLDRVLTQQELADLIAFLKSLK
jgi:putative membrane-bound dehydrogenase-like protein